MRDDLHRYASHEGQSPGGHRAPKRKAASEGWGRVPSPGAVTCGFVGQALAQRLAGAPIGSATLVASALRAARRVIVRGYVCRMARSLAMRSLHAISSSSIATSSSHVTRATQQSKVDQLVVPAALDVIDVRARRVAPDTATAVASDDQLASLRPVSRKFGRALRRTRRPAGARTPRHRNGGRLGLGHGGVSSQRGGGSLEAGARRDRRGGGRSGGASEGGVGRTRRSTPASTARPGVFCGGRGVWRKHPGSQRRTRGTS